MIPEKAHMRNFFLFFLILTTILCGCSETNPFVIEDGIIVDFSEGSKNQSSLIVPEGVTEIRPALSFFPNLKSIFFPKTITKIPSALFEDCHELEAITVASDNPAYVSSEGILYTANKNILLKYPEAKTNPEMIIETPTMAKGAFQNNPFLKKAIMTEGVLHLSASVFENCESLSEVVLSETLLEIPENAFKNCVSLADLEIPLSVKTIGASAFENCLALLVLDIPKSVLFIGSRAFANFTNLQVINLARGEAFQLWNEDWNADCQAATNFLGAILPENLYLALGDSLAAGYQSDNTMGDSYTDYVGEKLLVAELVNRFSKEFALSGMTSYGLRFRLEHDLFQDSQGRTLLEAAQTASIITISIGANDLLNQIEINFENPSLIYDSNDIDYALEALTENLTFVINQLAAASPNAQIYVLGYYMPLPFLAGLFSDTDYRVFGRLDETLKAISEDTGVRFVDISSASSTTFIPNPLNIHPGPAGYRYISEIVFQEIIKNRP